MPVLISFVKQQHNNGFYRLTARRQRWSSVGLRACRAASSVYTAAVEAKDATTSSGVIGGRHADGAIDEVIVKK